MKKSYSTTILSVLLVALCAIATMFAVHKFHKPGQLDAMTAQDMDMSQMRPPTGDAPVALVAARMGSLDNTVTYTGTVLAYNEQDITPRLTGTVIALPVYPGDYVKAGQLLAQLDSAEVGAKQQEAAANVRQAQIAHEAALLTHHLHHRAAIDQAIAQKAVAEAGVADAQAEVQADADSIGDANASVQSAQANAAYWTAEIKREKELADKGAVSLQEYQNELAQTQAADAAVSQAKAKVQEAIAMRRSASAKLLAAQRQVDAGAAGVKMADADLAIGQVQANEAGAVADAAVQSEREAAIVQGYATITSPANGIIASRPVSPGTLVQPGTMLMSVDEIDRVRVQANVAVTDMSGIHVGSPVAISFQGDDDSKPIPAAVTSVFPAANSQTRTDVVEAVIPNPGDAILPGAFVSVRITKNSVSNRLLVPADSVVEQSGQSYVWTAQGSQSATPMYECVICRIHYTAAQAKQYHYIDPMDGGKLVPLKPSINSDLGGELKAHEVAVTTGASDGKWTEILSGSVSAGDEIVSRGQAALTDGADVISTPWNQSGPERLPTAADANAGKIVYRCEKCGMTFSAADARRNNYIDPMDGGKLVEVKAAN